MKMSKHVKDLTGQQFNFLIILKFSHTNKNNSFWLCQCKCGNQKVICGDSIIRGGTKSCGCGLARVSTKGRKNVNFKDLTNKRFGRLIVLNLCELESKIGSYWNCKCDCGKLKVISRTSLIQGTKSCGCLAKELASRPRLADLTGKKFNNLLVVGRTRDKDGNVTWKCRCDCGLIIDVPSDRLRIRKQISCRKCFHKRQRGKNHPNWDKSISKEERKIAINRGHSPKLRTWRKRIFRRDNYTCQISSKQGEKICAHHIFNWRDNQNKRFDLDNGITLSKDLHKLFHAIYGLRYNTKQQLKEFKDNYQNGKINEEFIINAKNKKQFRLLLNKIKR